MTQTTTKFTHPQKLEFLSDGTVAEFDEILPKSTHRREVLYIYKYIDAGIKEGTLLPLREQDIEAMRKNSRIIVS